MTTKDRQDDSYLLACAAYVECNPSKANIIKIIQSMIEKGYSLTEIITHRVAKDLSSSAVQSHYYKYKNYVQKYAEK